MKTNEKKPNALSNFFGCKVSGIKKSFNKSSKIIIISFAIIFVLFSLIPGGFGENSQKCFAGQHENVIDRDTNNTGNTGTTIECAGVEGGCWYENDGKYAGPVSPYEAIFGGFKKVLIGVVRVVSKLLGVAGLLLDVTLDQNFFRAIIDNQGVYRGWVVVRDVLNIFFMLLLLFSAFSTIFQVEKYHLRKVIIMLVVMALLVNFSFPIALFIIDFSNSAMYFLIESAFGSSVSVSAKIADYSKFADALVAANKVGDLLAATILNIILIFILFISFFAVGMNLLIRILAFAILLILAPAGFTFAFFPGTKSVANEWWSALIKYAFLGPIMAFFLYLAMMIFDGTSPISENQYFTNALVKFLVPITFLWIGLVISQKFGGLGSSMAMNFAGKTGKWAKGAAIGAVVVGAGATGVPGALKQRYTEIKGGFNKSREDREARVAATFGSKGAMNDLERKRYKESLDKMKSFSTDDLKGEAKKGNIAAAEELLTRKALDQDVYRDVIKNSAKGKRQDDLTAKFKGANKESRIDVVASIDARRKADDKVAVDDMVGRLGLGEDQAKAAIIEDEIAKKIKLNSSEFSKQDFESIVKEIETKEKGDNLDKSESRAIKDAIKKSFSGLNAQAQSEIGKNIRGDQRAALKKMGIIV